MKTWMCAMLMTLSVGASAQNPIISGQWYLFYHHNDYSPQFDKNRSVRIDSLNFNPDGTIQKVILEYCSYI